VLRNTGPVLLAVAVGSHRVRHVLHVHHVLRLIRRRVRFLFRLDNLVVDIAAAVGIEGEGSIVVGVLGFGEVVGIYSGEVAGTPVEVQQVELMVPDLLPPSRDFGDLTELHSSAAEEQRRKQQRCS